MAFTMLRALPSTRKPRKPAGLGEIRRPKQVKMGLQRTLNYARIKTEVMEAIARLPHTQAVLIRASGTLPEQMVALALCWLKLPFQAQRSEDGGRLRLGGAVVDIVVFLGSTQLVIRVQGDYWHSLPDRKNKDAVQLERLRAKGYRVVDLWENAIYQAWVDGRLKNFVSDALQGAA
jgi:G:T-mismatch repair DNA endonuclease (very short patch repair protein)